MASQKLLGFFALGGVELVALGGDDHKGDAALIEIFQHHLVVCRRADAAVHQLKHQLDKIKVGVGGEISVGESGPFFLVGRISLGKAVAGQIHQKELFVHVVKVDGNGLSGCRADTCQRFPTQKGIDQRAFSHVGAPRKGDLHHGIGGELTGQSRADAKIGVVEIQRHT